MALSQGDRLGNYEIVQLLGAGGMGEVYKARDTRLQRIVAIKVLSAASRDDPTKRRRFEQEALVIAALDHPHICRLHDTGCDDGRDFLVIEYAEGETLAHRMRKGPLPLDRALRYAVEMADGLAAAHRHGIVHRDLKPGNIMLTPGGVKLLDFGLAKLHPLQPVTSATGLSTLNTERAGLTLEGTIVGTLQYMAPEQLEGKEMDVRSDLFSFGAVLYEMIAGKKAFEGGSHASVIAAILDRDPPSLSTIHPIAPSALDHVIKRCLAKDPDERWDTASDLKRELLWITEGSNSDPVAVAASAKAARRQRIKAALAGVLAGGLVATPALWRVRETAAPEAPLTRFAVPFAASATILSTWPIVAISPDGGTVVYSGEQGGTTQLYVRPIDQLEAKPLAGTLGARCPFFSPDGKWVGFFDGGALKKISLFGGQPTVLAQLMTKPTGASWGADNNIVFSSHFRGLSRVLASGGAVETLTTLDPGRDEVVHGWPQVLPGGKGVLFTAWPAGGGFDAANIVVHLFKTSTRQVVIEGGSAARYVPSGHLVYARGDSLLAVPFDLDTLAIRGTPVPVLSGVTTSGKVGGAQFAVSDTGALVYVPGEMQMEGGEPVWVRADGTVASSIESDDPCIDPALSPNGHRLAVCLVHGGNQDVWIYDVSTRRRSRLTSAETFEMSPIWTNDGGRVIFSSARGSAADIFWIPADGTGSPELLVQSPHLKLPTSWSGVHQALAFVEYRAETKHDIWILHPRSGRPAEPLIRTSFAESGPQFSPDGRWLAYQSDETGRAEIFVRSFPELGPKRQVSTNGGIQPRWARDGRQITYRKGDQMLAVRVKSMPGLEVEEPRVLFRGPHEQGGAVANYDVAPDGRFLMIKSRQQSANLQLVVVQNWVAALTRRMPALPE